MARKLDDHRLLTSGGQYTRSISPLGAVLGRAPGQAPPRGLIAQGRRSLLTKLQSLPAHGHGFRVLVIDTAAKKVLRQFTTLDECAREAGVCLCEDISAERFPLKDLNKVSANYFAFLFRIAHALKRIDEPTFGIHAFNINTHSSSQTLHDFVTFIKAE